MRILLLGASGQVGQQLKKDLTERTDHSLSFYGSPRSSGNIEGLDLHNPQAIERVIRLIQPHVIINAAAYTDVNKAEHEPFDAFRTNCIAVEYLASYGIPMIHFSTDFVYSGKKRIAPYIETDTTEPLSIYGRTKMLGDQALTNSGTPHINLRCSWVYGPTGNDRRHTNFVHKILCLMETEKQIKVVANEIGAPTSVRTLSRIVLAILKEKDPQSFIREHTGIYHACDKGFMSRYAYALEIFNKGRELGFPYRTEEFTEIYVNETEEMRRPLNSCLDTSKLESIFPGILPDSMEELQAILEIIRTA